jgi:hypothetical protein
VAETLLWLLRRLGDEYGPLGVALVAAQLTDPRVLIEYLSVNQPTPAQEPSS